MLPGDELVKKIADSIKENDYLGVIITESSKNSEWVTLEVEMALALEQSLGYSKVIPIIYGECDIPQFLNHKVYVNLYKDYKKGIKKILKVLKEPPKKFESRFILPMSVESFDEVQHQVNTVAEKFRLFKEDQDVKLKRKLEYIDQDSQRRGCYTTGLRLEERAKAKEDAEWEIKSRKTTSAYKIEEIQLKAKRLYPNKEILIPQIFKKYL
ncbi:hypothetical protein ES703_103504 [subsurface metagenome]